MKRSIWCGIPSKWNYTEKAREIPAIFSRKTPKQLQYLLDLARQRGVTPQQIAGQFQVGSIRDLTRKQCSDLIDGWRVA